MNPFESLKKYMPDKVITDEKGISYWLHMKDNTFQHVHLLSDKETAAVLEKFASAPCKFAMSDEYRLFRVVSGNEECKDKYGCVNIADKSVWTNAVYDVVGACNGKLLQVQQGEKMVYLNQSGDIISCPPVPNVDKVVKVSSDVVGFKADGKWGLSLIDGHVLFDPILDSEVFQFERFSYGEGVIGVRFLRDYSDRNVHHEKGKCAFIRIGDAARGDIHLYGDYSDVSSFVDGLGEACDKHYTSRGEVWYEERYTIDTDFNVVDTKTVVYDVEHDYEPQDYEDDVLRDNPPEDAFDGDLEAYQAWRDYR